VRSGTALKSRGSATGTAGLKKTEAHTGKRGKASFRKKSKPKFSVQQEQGSGGGLWSAGMRDDEHPPEGDVTY